MNASTDILFIHESKEVDKGENRIALFPIGVLGMADLLKRHGIRTTILHHLIEKTLSPGFQITAEIKQCRPKMICLDLQWHQQITSVLKLAKVLKKRNPRIPIVLGGLTASFFHKEIMNKYPEIDFLIRGDGEIPILKLADAILKTRSASFRDIPNLTYRSGRTVKTNPLSYRFNDAIASELTFSNFGLLKHWACYNRPGVFEGVISPKQDRQIYDDPVIFHYPCGRGCPNNCAICSGSRISQKKTSGRVRTVHIPARNVIKDLRNAVKYGINTWYNTFDPTVDKSYFLGLFRSIAKEKIEIGLQFECLQIPPLPFVRSAAKTFKKVRLDFVIQTGSDRLRRRIKGNYYSNRELVDFLAGTENAGIKIDLCFVAGLPFETRDDALKTLSLINFVRSRFQHVQCIATFLEVEPGSPVHSDPARFGIKLRRKTFSDFIRDHNKASGLGYETTHFDAKDIRFLRLYYNAESRCKKRASGLLAGLLSNNSALQDTDVRSWHHFCEDCQHYEECFKKA